VKFETSRLTGVNQVWSARNVYNCTCQSVIKGNRCITVTTDTGFVAKCLLEGLTQNDRGVFDGVVCINVCVAGCSNLEVKQRVLGEGGEQVVEKRNSGRNARLAGSV
jgi:hypothetical protein